MRKITLSEIRSNLLIIAKILRENAKQFEQLSKSIEDTRDSIKKYLGGKKDE